MDDREVSMEYRLRDGGTVGDDALEEMASEWGRGEWEGHLENVVVGLPDPEEDALTTVSFRMPRSRLAAVEAAVLRAGITKSEFYRRAVDRELAALS